ncbi:hypothetical protein ACLOJK_027345 [Asimina triloba]
MYTQLYTPPEHRNPLLHLLQEAAIPPNSGKGLIGRLDPSKQTAAAGPAIDGQPWSRVEENPSHHVSISKVAGHERSRRLHAFQTVRGITAHPSCPYPVLPSPNSNRDRRCPKIQIWVVAHQIKAIRSKQREQATGDWRRHRTVDTPKSSRAPSNGPGSSRIAIQCHDRNHPMLPLGLCLASPKPSSPLAVVGG